MKPFLLLFVATPLFAQTVALTPRGVVVAHDRLIEVYNARTLQRISSSDGVAYPGCIAGDDANIAVLDPLHNQARLNGTTISTHETPIAAAFVDHQLFILERDSRTLSRGDDSVRTGAYPQFLRTANKKLYVYSAIDGSFQEITASPFAVGRVIQLPPFATDLEVENTTAYLTYPRKRVVQVVDLEKMEDQGNVKVGTWPMDLTLGGGNNVITARVIAVADPVSKRVWSMEGRQSTAGAFGRGVLRGLLGMGRFGGNNPELATGPDRVVALGTQWVAYDSSTGTLYNIARSKVNVLARGIAPYAFAVGEGVVFIWRGGTLVAQKLNG
jgi:hypothetical protein